MGRFYKTTAATPSDFMYELPKEVMLGAIQALDKNINKQQDSISDAQTKLVDIKNLKGDDPEVQAQLDKYNTQFDNLAKQIMEDPLSFRKFGADIRGASRTMQEDLSRGMLGVAQKNYQGYEDYSKALDENKELSDQRKDLLKRAALSNYGKMDYKGTGDYKDINDSLITGFKDIDDNEYIKKIGEGWEPDKTSESSSEPTGTGYIRTVDGDVRIRNEADVEEYVKKDLKASGWYDQKKQIFDLQNTLGEYSGVDIAERMSLEEQMIIDKAKNKLGFRQESNRDRLSGDPVYAAKQRKIDAGSGVVSTEFRDNTKNASSKIFRDSINTAIDQMGQEGKIGKFSSSEDLLSSIKNPSEDGSKSYLSGFTALQTTGMFKGPKAKQKYNEWVNANLHSEVPYVTASKTLTTAFNTRALTQPVEGIYITDSQGNRSNTGFVSQADMLNKNGHNGYVYLPATGTRALPPIYKTNANGNLISKNGVVLLDDNRKPTKDPAKVNYINSGEEKVSIDEQKVATYTNDAKKLLNASAGDLKIKTTSTSDLKGKLTHEKMYTQTNQLIKLNLATNLYETISIETDVNPKTLIVK